MEKVRDPWKVLGVAPGTTPEGVRRAYLRLVREHHPDRYPSGSAEARWHEERLREVIEAYRSLPLGHDPRPRRQEPVRRPIDLSRLRCGPHDRWAVIFCRVCDAPLCSRCDTTLSGLCPRHRRRG